MVAKLGKKKKVKVTYSRKSGGGYGAAPINNFWHFKDYARTEIDKKDTSKVIKDYVKKNFSKAQAKTMLAAPEWKFAYAYFIASTIVWSNLEKEIPKEWNHKPLFKSYFDDLAEAGKRAQSTAKEEPIGPVKKSPMEIVKDRTSEFIANVEEIIDIWSGGVWLDVDNYSPFNELMQINAPYNIAKGVFDYYTPILEEARELVEQKPKDLDEAYSHMTPKRRKEYLKLLEIIVADAEKYMLSKKAVRAVRRPKKLTADKQVSKLNYLNDSTEFKLTSISPINIPGGRRLYTFNTKNKKLTEYVSDAPNGFEIKGSTLQYVDLDNSRETTLRKPDEFLTIVQKKTPTVINKEWKKLTTKTTAPNARINKDTILVRVLDK